MPTIFGKNYTKEALLQHVGNLQQIGGIRTFQYSDGKAAGTQAIQLDTGCLSLTLLPSRCLDIAFASYKGYPFGYISKSGIRNPSYFTENGAKGFSDSFFGGLLTTSGLNNIGAPSTAGDTNYGLHGEMSNIPADHVSIDEYWEKDELYFEIKSVMHHSRFYGEDIQFTRKIKTSLGSASILIHDSIENLDFKPFPLFLLYHINLGFPLVNEHAYIQTSSVPRLEPRTESATSGLKNAMSFQKPQNNLEEECFYYAFTEKNVKIALTNPCAGDRGLSFYLKYDTTQLPVFTEWKMMRSREYVCGFAPSTNRLEGRENALQNERVRFLMPLEKADFEIQLGIEE